MGQKLLTLSGTPNFTTFGEFMIVLIRYIHYVLLNLSVYDYGYGLMTRLPGLVWLLCLGFILFICLFLCAQDGSSLRAYYTFILVFRSKSSTTNQRKLRRSLWLHKPKKSKQNMQMNSVYDNIHFQKTSTCIHEHPAASSITPAKCRPRRRRSQLFEDNTQGTYLHHEYE